MYGILRLNITRKLGETTYSVYLLHGIFLYCLMTWIIPNNYTENTFIILVSTTAFLITFTLCLTFKLIETPFIKLTKQTTTLVKELIPTLTNNNQ